MDSDASSEMGNTSDPKSNQSNIKEPVWTYRGYQLGPGEFTTAMSHFFRAEISRANIWRQRLDTTTNWAVVITAAIITFSLSAPSESHFAILLSMVLITLFLVIEARRYRYYELWSSRVRLMETDFFAAMLVPPFHPAPDWAESLAENLLQPHFPISSWEAIGRRLRRNYIWIFTFLYLAWIVSLWLKPEPAQSMEIFIERASVGGISGLVVFGLATLYLCIMVVIAVATITLQEASGEVLPSITFPSLEHKKNKPEGVPAKRKSWFRPQNQRQKLVALIITDKGEAIAAQVLEEMNRGVTSLEGKGMYTGQRHQILLCAITVTEVNQLKIIVRGQDAQAFVVVMPAQEIFGKGFIPFEKDQES